MFNNFATHINFEKNKNYVTTAMKTTPNNLYT